MQERLKEAVARLKAEPGRVPEGETGRKPRLPRLAGRQSFHIPGLPRLRATAEDDGGRLDPVRRAAGSACLSDERRALSSKSARTARRLTGASARLPRSARRRLIITKSNRAKPGASPRAYGLYRRQDVRRATARLLGERRFVGLFTSGAYSRRPRDIPLLRRKMRRVMTRAGLAPASHDGKALAHILDTFPRDELFQISEDELYAIAIGILQLGGRPKVRAVPALRPLRPLRLRARVRAARHATTSRRANDPRHPGPRLRRPACRRRIPTLDESRAGAHPLHHRPQRGPAPGRWMSRALEREIRRRDPHLGRRLRRSAVARAMAKRGPAAVPRPRAGAFPARLSRCVLRRARRRADLAMLRGIWRARRRRPDDRGACLAQGATTRTARCASSCMCWATALPLSAVAAGVREFRA